MTYPDVTDRGLGALRRIIQTTLPAIKFLAPWEYRVELVNPDGTCELTVTDTTSGMPDLRAITTRSGVPGATVKPAVGSLCVVAFVNGDPQRPRVMGGYDTASSQGVTIDTGTGTSEHVTTIEAVCNLLIAATALMTPAAPLTDVTLASAIATATGTSLGALTLAALAAALAAKTGDSSGSKPGVGCPRLRAG